MPRKIDTQITRGLDQIGPRGPSYYNEGYRSGGDPARNTNPGLNTRSRASTKRRGIAVTLPRLRFTHDYDT